jgi:hypothetical protein
MARRCRDCLRCKDVFGGGGDLDRLLLLYTSGLWLLWLGVRPRCPRCAHARRAHTRSKQRWHRQDYWRSVEQRRRAHASRDPDRS